MKIQLFATAIVLLVPQARAECRAVNIKEFREATQTGPRRLLFFASWCSTCAQHIKVERIKDTIFIAAADEKAKADKVLKKYLQDHAAEASCFFDKDGSIADTFGIRKLPIEKSLADLPKL